MYVELLLIVAALNMLAHSSPCSENLMDKRKVHKRNHILETVDYEVLITSLAHVTWFHYLVEYEGVACQMDPIHTGHSVCDTG